MATTTPNYGWPVPTSTDLVKNGAVAIESLGDAIDASLLDLRGGTTGQVLAKQTNAQMDFAWVTDATGISPTIVDAKGDLIAATANDTPARLAVGADGSTLVANSAASTGLSWAGQPYANPVLNSAFQVWQRGTSFTSVGSFSANTADRWGAYRGSVVGGMDVSRQNTSDTTNLPNIQYCARVQRTSGNASTEILYFNNIFESVNSIPYAGKAIVFSFYARKGANFSSSSNNIFATLRSGTGTDQNVTTGFTGAIDATSGTATLTSTWQRFSYTGTVPTNSSQLAILFSHAPTGTAGANDYYEITGVQIDLGSVALPFKTYAGTIAGELAACQRYYTREKVTTTYCYLKSFGNATTTTLARIIVPFAVEMRIKPSSFDTGGALAVSDGVNLYGSGSFVLSTNSTTQNAQMEYTHGSAVFTQFRYESFQDNNNGSTYLGFSAEL